MTRRWRWSAAVSPVWPLLAGFLLCGLLVGGWGVAPALAIVYVDSSRPGGDGTSWDKAYASIETAVVAKGANEEFWVAGGAYPLAAPLTLKAGTRLYGGFAGTETTFSQRSLGAYPTVLDGQNAVSHVIKARMLTSTVLIDGFTIMRGRAGSPGTENAFGGGIYVYLSAATITNCDFTANSAVEYGGAVFARESVATISDCSFSGNAAGSGGGVAAHPNSTLTLSSSTFAGNTATAEGGALFTHNSSAQVSACTFSGNTATDGGAVDLNGTGTIAITASSFTGNSSKISGGAVAAITCNVTIGSSTFTSNSTGEVGGGYYSHTAPTTITDCIFWRNQATGPSGGGGGAMLDYSTGTTDLVERTQFIDNYAALQGGGFYSYQRSATLDSCIFLSNRSHDGGGIRVHAGDPGSTNPTYVVTLRNCTLSRNAATNYGGGIINTHASALHLYNCILWDNSATTEIWGAAGFVTTPDIFNSGSGSVTTRYSDIQSLTWAHGSVSESHTGSFSLDPRFTNPKGVDNIYGTLDDDVRLAIGSPCIDSGDGANGPLVDLAGYPRRDVPEVSNTGVGSPPYVDIGAYERLSQAGTTPNNRAPVLTAIGDITVEQGQGLSITLTASDLDGDALMYTSTPLPAGAALDSASGVFFWTPGYAQGGSYQVTFAVSDGQSADSESVRITVLGPAGPVFFDDFADGAASTDWRTVSGNWSAARGIYGTTSTTRTNHSAIIPFDAATSPLGAGVIQAKIKLTSSYGLRGPNGLILFAYQNPTLYRYVKVTRSRLIIGQTGPFAGVPGGAKNKVVKSQALNRFALYTVKIYPDGWVRVYKGSATTPTLSYQFLSGGAPSVVPGGVGLAATKAKTLFDNVAVWDDSSL